MTVLDLITLLRRGWKILAVTIIVGALAGVAYGLTAPKVYQSTATGFIAVDGSSVVAGSDEAVARAGAYMPLINTSQVRDGIAEAAGVSPGQLSGSLSAAVVPGSTLIQVTATSSDPQSALKLADGALVSLAQVVESIEGAVNTGTDENGEQPVGAAGITIVPMDSAVAPTEPISPNLRLAVVVGALAGLVVGVIIIVLRRALDVRVRAHTDITALVGTGVLGRVPKINPKGTSKKDQLVRTVADEAYRQIRTGLRFASVDDEVVAVMITSANQGEGKSHIARALARVVAESGRRTLIIDGDLRRPTVASGFGIDGTVGLSEVLSGQVTAPSAVRSTNDPNLFVLPAGGIPPNPSEMLGSTAMHQLLRELRRDFFVIVDAPPVLPVTDASVLSAAVDGVVFVAAVGKTRRHEVAEARTQLEQAHARVLGVVLNLVSLKGDQNGYGYYRQNSRYYAQARVAQQQSAANGDATDAFSSLGGLTPASLVSAEKSPSEDAGSSDTPKKSRAARRSTQA